MGLTGSGIKGVTKIGLALALACSFRLKVPGLTWESVVIGAEKPSWS